MEPQPDVTFPSPCAEGVEVPRMNNFLTQIIEEDLAAGKYKYPVTRFPPEPNGWLHIGHAKSICLNFGLAKQYNGKCHLRFDDTNPAAEETEYIEGIQQDVEWLGFRWNGNLFYASDYFEQLYEWAMKLIDEGLAYVDEQTEEEVRVNRGSLTEPGKNSPWRDRPIEESRDLFRRMRAGEFPDGKMILRAKIDMTHGNMNMRDPPIYRIKHCSHPRTGDKWCIYPIYDFAHGQSDSIERITHSICTLEFYDHRALYDWFIDKLKIYPSHQYEFARFNLTHTVMSKRRLLKLVTEKYVRGWDDPRMPTLAGCRRRGYPAKALRNFSYGNGVAKREHTIHMSKLETCVRDELADVPRRLAVVDPIKVLVSNIDDGSLETFQLGNHPDRPELGSRQIRLGKVLYIDRSDWTESPPEGYRRLCPGATVRLRGAFPIKVESVEKDGSGEVVTLVCSRVDNETAGKKIGVVHWVSEADSVPAELRLYETLFSTADADEGGDWLKNLNPKSLTVCSRSRVESCLQDVEKGERFQFERVGYFTADYDTRPGAPVFNLTVSLQDTFTAKTDAESKQAKAKQEQKQAREAAAAARAAQKALKEQKAREKAEKKAAAENSAKSTDAALAA